MRILIAEDDMVSRRVLETTLRKWGHDPVIATDGAVAWSILRGGDAPPLAVLDWMMPGADGVELCRRVREAGRATYLILLTAKGTKDDMVTGLDAGADDYVVKPFNRDELRARIGGGVRVVELQQSLAARVGELETALASVQQLQGLLPICSYCKSIRSHEDENYWQGVEQYITEHSDAQFSHGICPGCSERQVKPQLESLQERQRQMS
jgi:sigma-B regulation protein RsbU (phosphoserine phosphatase)